jgi:hypothetical protein
VEDLEVYDHKSSFTGVPLKALEIASEEELFNIILHPDFQLETRH